MQIATKNDVTLLYTHTRTLTPSQLIAMGVTKEEISHRVREKAISESEDIYETLYGALGEEGDMDDT